MVCKSANILTDTFYFFELQFNFFEHFWVLKKIKLIKERPRQPKLEYFPINYPFSTDFNLKTDPTNILM